MMKKYITVFILLLIHISLHGQIISFNGSDSLVKPSITVLSSDNNGMIVEITLSSLEQYLKTENGEAYQNLRFLDYFTTMDIGKPQLPCIREFIGVPEFSNYKVTLLDSASIILNDYDIYPFQKLLNEGETGTFYKDESFYKINKYYPEKIIELDMNCIWRDIRVSRLNIFPVMNNPVSRELKIYTRLVIRIDYENPIGTAIVSTRPISEEWDKIYQSAILNYNQLFPTTIKSLSKVTSAMSPNDYDYLIITKDEYYDEVQPLAQWKMRKGYKTKVTLLSTVGNIQTSIKNYIQSEYNNYGIKYVLLVGNETAPCLSYDSQYNTYGDYWYVVFDTTFLPYLAIGRFPADSENEVIHMIDKSIKYESDPPSGNWTENVLLVSHKENAPNAESFQACSETIRTANYFPYTPAFTKDYGASIANGGTESINSSVTSHINSGFGLVNYRGHGDISIWENWNISQENYTSSIARSLENGNKTPVVFSIACSNAAMGYAESIAEAFIKADDGAVAILAATMVTDHYINNEYDKELIKEAYNSANREVGNISNLGAIEIINRYFYDGCQNSSLYLWFGDPALELLKMENLQFTNVTFTENGSSLVVNSNLSGCEFIAYSMDNGASYYEKILNSSSATFSTSIRPLYITIRKQDYIPFVGISGGNISSNTTFRSIIKVMGNLYVTTGTTLTINPDTRILFNPNTSITINGSLYSVGTPTKGITFDRLGSSGTWGGIQFNSGSSGNLDYCTITNASTGIYCYNSSPSIRHSTLDYNGTGLSCNEYSSPVLVGNNFRNNTSYGLRTNNYSSPNLTDNGYPGSNVIRNNTTGIFATYSSNPNLNGYMTYGNSVFNNSSYEVMAYYYCTVNADRVFWNSVPPPSSEFATIGSTINRNYPLSTNPNPNRSIIEKGEQGNMIASYETYPTDIQMDDLSQALEKQREKRYDEAIVLFLEVFKKNKEELVGKYALTKIEECFTQSGKKDYLQFSEKEIKPDLTEGTKTYVIALELEAHQMVNAEEYTGAINNLNSILTKFNLNEDIEKNTLFTLGSIYTLFTENKRDADNYFNTLKTKYPDDDLTSQIEIIKGMGNNLAGDNKIILPNPEIKSEPVSEYEEISISNYPNPFNPETTISFWLPQGGNTKLIVYDVLGREVLNLADGFFEQGKHEIRFDGNNLSTGIYFYRLTTPLKTITKKMLLVK
jgi:hypothetical protein